MKIKQILCAAALMTASCNLYADLVTEYTNNAKKFMYDLDSCHKPVARLYLDINKTEDHVDKVNLKKYADTIEDKLSDQYPDYKTVTVSHLFLSPDKFLSSPTLITTFYACDDEITVDEILVFLEKNIYPAYRNDDNKNFAQLFEFQQYKQRIYDASHVAIKLNGIWTIELCC